MMKIKQLGKSSLRVSEVFLGAGTFGTHESWGADRRACEEMLERFLGAGGNFIDTSSIYQAGESERMVGELVAGRRDKLIIASKFGLGGHLGNPSAGGSGMKAMRIAVDESLRRLKTDYIDLYWLHAWDGITDAEELMYGLETLVRQGKILHVGFSDTPAWLVAQAVTIANERGWARPIAIQVQYNLIARTPEAELFPMANALQLGIVAWGIVSSGLLTGKYRNANEGAGRLSGKNFTGSRAGVEDTTLNPLWEIADELKVEPGQVAMAWLNTRSSTIFPILGARTAAQLQSNLAFLTVRLSDAQIARLDAIGPPPAIFPSAFLKSEGIQRRIFGDTLDRLALSPSKNTR